MGQSFWAAAAIGKAVGAIGKVVGAAVGKVVSVGDAVGTGVLGVAVGWVEVVQAVRKRVVRTTRDRNRVRGWGNIFKGFL